MQQPPDSGIHDTSTHCPLVPSRPYSSWDKCDENISNIGEKFVLMFSGPVNS